MEGHKIILKLEIPMISWMVLDNHSISKGSAQEFPNKKGHGLYSIML